MTKRVKACLDSFEQLNDKEQQTVVAVILRRHFDCSQHPLSDMELNQIAEERFLELDRREKETV